jgi:glycosyltransferase involved in cell wall biosynthesis
LGIGLYCPIYSGAYLHPNTGKNIKYIGLSSGKISTYLQNGLPIIVHDDTMYSQKIDKYNFGYAVKSVDDIANILENFKPNQQINEECLRFFYDELDFNNYKSMILEILNKKIAI